jgi:hypothetical protein
MVSPRALNDWDRRLLKQHLGFYRDLDSGRRPPTTQAQHRFVTVCRGRTPPRSQHEIAYWHFIQLQRARASDAREKTGAPIQTVTAPAPPFLTRKLPSSEASAAHAIAPPRRGPSPIDVVDAIEAQQFRTDTPPPAQHVLARLKLLYFEGRAKALSLSADATMWLNTVLSESDLSQSVTAFLTERHGDLSNVYTRAMDGISSPDLRISHRSCTGCSRVTRRWKLGSA